MADKDNFYEVFRDEWESFGKSTTRSISIEYTKDWDIRIEEYLIGGNLDCYSCSVYKDKVTHSSWKIVTFLNRRHQLFAWLSLVWVGFSDVYVRLVSMGIINDINTWGL